MGFSIVLSLLPVIVFLFCLFLLDSFKLVSKILISISVFWGLLSVVIAYYINTEISDLLNLNFTSFTRYLAPIIEEILKSCLIIYLFYKKKIGFAIDAIIYGFAVGTGFALLENIYYLLNLSDPNIFVAIVRGFGTALMHGGCTALFALIAVNLIQQDKKLLLVCLISIIPSIVLHSAFNHVFFNPFIQTAIVFAVLPIVFNMVFVKRQDLSPRYFLNKHIVFIWCLWLIHQILCLNRSRLYPPKSLKK